MKSLMNIMKFKTSLKESLLGDIDEVSDKLDVRDMIKKWLNEHKVTYWKIRDDNTIDANIVNLIKYPEAELPEYIQFNEISDAFFVYKSKLKTLRGCPKKVKGTFNCSDCENLESLEGAPKITGNFYCDNCPKIKSLKGGPTKVNGSIYSCTFCGLETLKGAPKKVNSFYCGNCLFLKDLKYCPECINLNCTDSICLQKLNTSINAQNIDFTGCKSLETIEDLPTEIKGSVNLSYCSSLKSLKGCPEMIKVNLIISGCTSLESLDYLPKKVGGMLSAVGCNIPKEDIPRLENICRILTGVK